MHTFHIPPNLPQFCGSGSHTAIHLVREFPRCHVVVLDKLDYCSSLKNLDAIAKCKNFTFVKVSWLVFDLFRILLLLSFRLNSICAAGSQGNILCVDTVNLLIKRHNIDTVLHFAAQSHVGMCYHRRNGNYMR